jgi:hypothetical protein
MEESKRAAPVTIGLLSDWDFSEHNSVNPTDINLAAVLDLEDDAVIVRALVQQAIKCGFKDIQLGEPILKKTAHLKEALAANLEAAIAQFKAQHPAHQNSVPSQATHPRREPTATLTRRAKITLI